MRVALLLVTIIVLALAAWLAWPLLAPGREVAFEDVPVLGDFIGSAPIDTEEIILVPSFSSAWRAYGPLLERRLGEGEGLPAAAAWLIGASPTAIWTRPDSWGGATRPDPIRRFLIPFLAARFLDLRVEREGDIILFNPNDEPTIGEIPRDCLSERSGSAFVIRLAEGGFPPIPRPAFTAISFDGDRLKIASCARGHEPLPTTSLTGVEMPSDALIAIRFAEPPPAIESIEKAVPIDLTRYLADGGSVALYGIETGGLVPRPSIVFGIRADDDRAAGIMAELDRATTRGAMKLLLGMGEDRTRVVGGVTVTRREGIGLTIEFARRGDELLIAFDGRSLEKLLSGGFVPTEDGEVSWHLRARPDQLLPVLDDLGSNPALRLFAEDFSRETRKLAAEIRALPPARLLVATVKGGQDGLVRLDATVELTK
ncbi:MAG TPA: hypothetical protein VM557_01330 [Thermoanaerobaculia bacterium]|nr:hypothetical protein [Thermoanaerobaculia bacterium]